MAQPKINSMLQPKSTIKAVPNFTSPTAQSPRRTKQDARNETDASGNWPNMVTPTRDKAPKILASCMDIDEDVLGEVASENVISETDQTMEKAGTGKTATEEKAKAADKAKKMTEEEEVMKREEMEVDEAKKAAEIDR